MARKYRRRRYYRRKGRWSTNIKDLADEQTFTASQWSGNSIDLCLNPIQDSLTVSQQYTIKNVELSVSIDLPGGSATALFNSLEQIQHYIMYVPQGMNLTTDYNLEHPEYIMAYYFQGPPNSDSSTGQNGINLKIKSRMARRLQTGDRIIYFYKAVNTSTTDIPVEIRGLVRWWTKAN